MSNITKFQEILSIFNYRTKLGLTSGKYSINNVFEVKIEIRMFEISIRPDFNKFWDQFGVNNF